MAGQKISLSESYKILQVSSSASMQEVKQAYRKRAFELHPDLNPNNASANKDFQDLNEAYVLVIDNLDGKEKQAEQKTQSSQTTKTKTKSSQKTWSQNSWAERAKEDIKKAEEERLKREAERAKKDEERKERAEREKQANERLRAKERAAREASEREKLREKLAQDDLKREEKRKAEAEKRRRKELEQEEREKARVLRQMEMEAKRNEEAKKREEARRERFEKQSTPEGFETQTRGYSNFGKPIFEHIKSQVKEKTGEAKGFFSKNKKAEQDKLGDEALKEQILKELLEDDYARKVYEDIYNELQNKKAQEKTASDEEPFAKNTQSVNNEPKTEQQKQEEPKKTVQAEYIRPEQKKATPKENLNQRTSTSLQTKTNPNLTGKITKNIKSGLSGWMKNQIDDELELFLPASRLMAGARMRLQIRTGWTGEAHTVELTLPADFVPGKPFRLKGMGKKIGKWQGDLYLKLQAK